MQGTSPSLVLRPSGWQPSARREEIAAAARWLLSEAVPGVGGARSGTAQSWSFTTGDKRMPLPVGHRSSRI